MLLKQIWTVLFLESFLLYKDPVLTLRIFPLFTVCEMTL